MTPSSSSSLDKPLSCPRPLPIGLEWKPNGTFLYESCRRHRRTGILLKGTGTPSVSRVTEEEDAASFQKLLMISAESSNSSMLNHQLLHDHLSSIFSSRRWDLRLASIELRVGEPAKVYLVNGTSHDLDSLVVSSSDVVQLVQQLEWDRVLPTYSVLVSDYLHRVTWHPYRRLCFRMGRRQAHPECRRVVETVCTQWLASSAGKRSRSLGVVGTTGKTTVLRQLLRTLVDYHSHLTVGVVSETAELYGMEGVLDIPLQRHWKNVAQKMQVLVVDVSSELGGRDSCETLSRGGVFVASSHWTSADLMFYIQHEAPWYQLVRQRKQQRRHNQQS